MPTYEVRRVKPILTTLIFEAASEDEARYEQTATDDESERIERERWSSAESEDE